MTDVRTYRYAAQTHVGLKRKVNEDAILALPEHHIWLVSDGMGGHQAGDFASSLIVDSVASLPVALDPTEKMHGLRDKIQGAHRAIDIASDRGEHKLGMQRSSVHARLSPRGSSALRCCRPWPAARSRWV